MILFPAPLLLRRATALELSLSRVLLFPSLYQSRLQKVRKGSPLLDWQAELKPLKQLKYATIVTATVAENSAC